MDDHLTHSFEEGRARMKKMYTAIWMVLSLGAISPIARAQTPSSPTVPVTIDNYNRAQTDVYFALIAKGGGFGKLRHKETGPPSIIPVEM